MFRALIGIGLAAAAVVGLWAGGETLASRRVAELIAGDPALQATLVRPLRQPPQFGMRIEQPAFADPAGGIALPWAEVQISPQSPTTARLILPREGQVTIAGQAHVLGLADSHATIRLAPLKRLAPALAARVAPGGTLVLSGLLAGDVTGVLAAYRAQGFTLAKRRDLEGWAALTLKRGGTAPRPLP